MGRILARLLVLALKSTVVQTTALETTRYIGRRAAAFLLRKLRAGSKPATD